MFARGLNGALWQIQFDNGTWSGWSSLGGGLIGGPAASYSESQRQIGVYIRGLDNALWFRFQTDGTWGRWWTAGGILTSDPGAGNPTEDGIVYETIFVRGANNNLWQYDATNYHWSSLGRVIADSPDAVSREGSPSLIVAVRGTDNKVWLSEHPSTSDDWGPWFTLGGPVTGGPALVAVFPDDLAVFVRNSANNIYFRYYTP